MPSNRIDIVMPVKNGATTIKQAHQSIRRQSHTQFRVVIVNDGSTDTSEEISHRIWKRDDRFMIVQS